MPKLSHLYIEPPSPATHSPLLDDITELEQLRRLDSTASQRHIQGIHSRNLHE